MSTPQKIKVTERDDTLNPRQLRSAGFIPATLYGKNIESRSIQVREEEFVRLYRKSETGEFELEGLDGQIIAKVQAVQSESVSEKVLSIQFLQLSPQGPETAARPPKRAAQAPRKAPETVLSNA